MATIAADSSESGYLRPDPGPEYDADLEDILQDLIVGMTGLGGTMVRPRYQVNPPSTPEQATPWAAFSVSIEGADWNPVVISDPNANAGAGEHRVCRQELVGLNVSFYGPGSWNLATVMRDGFGVGQNRDAVEAKGLKFAECASLVYAPFQLKDVWVKKTDLKVFFRRWVTRTYGIRNLASADGTIDNERYVTTFSAHQP